MDQSQSENQIRQIFQRLPQVEPSPYMAGRIVTQVQALRRSRRQLWIWRWVAAASLTALIAVVTVNKQQSAHEALYASQPYVIHVNFDDNEVKLAASAEIELPDGVSFVSRDSEIQALRRMKLPVNAEGAGRNRLPFVVKSDRTGDLALQVHIYDAQDNLIQTKTLTLHFVRAS